MKLLEGIIWNENLALAKAAPAEIITRLYDPGQDEPRSLVEWQNHWVQKNMRTAGAQDIYQVLSEIYSAQQSGSLTLINAAEIARTQLLAQLQNNWQTTSTTAIDLPGPNPGQNIQHIMYNAYCKKAELIDVTKTMIGTYPSPGVHIETVLADTANQGLQLMQAIFKTEDPADVIKTKLYRLGTNYITVTRPERDTPFQVLVLKADSNNWSLHIDFKQSFFKDGSSLGVPI